MRLDLAGVGLSVVTGARERLYGRVSGIRLRATGSQARRTLELALHSVQARQPGSKIFEAFRFSF